MSHLVLFACDDSRLRNLAEAFSNRHGLPLKLADPESFPASPEPEIALIGPECPQPIRLARQLSRLWPRCKILLAADPASVPPYSLLGVQTTVVAPERLQEELPRIWVAQSKARRHQTTLARLNSQLVKADVPPTRRLEISDRYLATLLLCAHDAILSLDAEGAIVTWNPAASRLFGYTEAEITGRPFTALQAPGQGWQPTASPHSTHLGTRHEVECRRKDGTHFTAEITCAPILDNHGHFLGSALILRDNTHRREAENYLRHAREAAEAASQAKTTFLANMSHEIRTPLTAILGFSELLAASGLDAETRDQYLFAIRRNGEVLTRLISDVLDLSKVEAGKLEIVLEPVSLQDLLADVLEALQLSASEKGLELTLEIHGAIPQTIHTDATRLKQILNNIVGNSLKFTTTGSVRVEVCLRGTDLEFMVRDTGRGIAPQNWNKLFEPFSQEDASTTRQYGGSGLGLALSRSLARKLGGDVQLVQSAPGSGSVFRITIPSGTVAGVPMITELGSQKAAAAICWDPVPDLLRGAQLLVAEDMPDNRYLICHMLEASGGHVTVCDNGEDALRKAREQRFDVLILDVQMPQKDGLTVARTLRSEGYDEPIIALTAHASAPEQTASLEAGCNAHLTKPIDFPLLVRTVQQLLSR